MGLTAQILEERSDSFWGVTNPGGNATCVNFPTIQNVTTRPDQASPAAGVVSKGDGVIICGMDGSVGPRTILLLPFGTGPAGSTFSMAAYGWDVTTGSLFQTGLGPLAQLWIPTLLASWSVVMGTSYGVAGADINAAQCFAASVTQTFGPLMPTGDVVEDNFTLSAGAGNAQCSFRPFGCRFVQVVYQMGTASSANALYKKR